MPRGRTIVLRKSCPALLLALLGIGEALGQSPSENRTDAAGRLALLRNEVHDARVSGNKPAYLDGARRLYRFLNGSPRATLQLMAAEEFAGRRTEALANLRAFVRMGQSDPDVLDTQAFGALRQAPQTTAILQSMQENEAAAGDAHALFSLGNGELVPEDIDYDPVTERFFISTVLGRSILSVARNGDAGVFTRSPDGLPVMALKVDVARRRLWCTEVAVGDGRSSVLLYSLSDGTRLRRIEAPAGQELGDLALDAGGDAYISDGRGGGLYRVRFDGERLERVDAGDFLSPQTVAVLAGAREVWVPDYLRGIGLLDLHTRQVRWLSSQGRFALSGIDGLYLAGRTLLATQNGTSPERVIAFTLDAGGTRVVAERIIERATPSLGDPTHAVVVGQELYYLANSGWETLDDHAQRKQGMLVTPALLMRARLSP